MINARPYNLQYSHTQTTMVRVHAGMTMFQVEISVMWTAATSLGCNTGM